MTVQFAPGPQRRFGDISQALAQGISQGVERSRSQDILDNIIDQALQQQGGDILSNLLTGIKGSGATLGEGLETVQRFAPIIESTRKQAQNVQENAFINELLGNQAGVPQPEDRGQPISTEGESLNRDQFDTLYKEQQYPGQTPQNKSKLELLPDSKLTVLQGHPNENIQNVAKAEVERRKLERRSFESDREFASKLAQPFLKRIDESRDSVRLKEFASNSMEDAILNGNTGFWSLDNLANITGIEGLRTAKGAQLVTSLKEFLLGNIQRAGSRPNQWIEQQIAQMAPRIGRSKEANLTVTKMLQSETALEKKKIELTDKLSEQFRRELGFVPENIGQQVDQALKPFADDIQMNLAYDLRKIHEQEQGLKPSDINKKVPKGTPLTIQAANLLSQKFDGDKKKAIEQAKRLGYEIPTPEQFRRWES